MAFMKAMDLSHWVMRAVLYGRIDTAIIMVSKVDTYCIVVLFSVALAAFGAILPMAAFSGFYDSPGSTPQDNARGIAPSHCHGDQNGQQRRYIC